MLIPLGTCYWGDRPGELAQANVFCFGLPEYRVPKGTFWLMGLTGSTDIGSLTGQAVGIKLLGRLTWGNSGQDDLNYYT